MAIGIHPTGPQPLPYGRTEQFGAKARSAQDSSQGTVDDVDVDETPAGRVQKFVQSSDELSAAATQFANRRRFDKKGDSSSESFERVLDDDAMPKAKSLLKVASVKEESLENLLRYARSMFPDESDLVMVLRELLRREKDKVLKKRLKALLGEMEEKGLARETKAGINCALKARLFGQKHLALKSPLLRGSYRRFLQNDQNGAEDYKDWIAAYGYQHRGDVLNFIESALLADIDSLDPSCSRMEFGELLGKLGQLKRLRSGDVLFFRKLLSNRNIDKLEKSEPEWLVLFFSLLQYPERINDHLYVLLGEAFLAAYHSERSTVLQIIFQACKSLPPELFDDGESLFMLLSEIEALASIAHGHELIERRRR